jgi:hypothetical protein
VVKPQLAGSRSRRHPGAAEPVKILCGMCRTVGTVTAPSIEMLRQLVEKPRGLRNEITTNWAINKRKRERKSASERGAFFLRLAGAEPNRDVYLGLTPSLRPDTQRPANSISGRGGVHHPGFLLITIADSFSFLIFLFRFVGFSFRHCTT